jgi:hypothetical protein
VNRTVGGAIATAVEAVSIGAPGAGRERADPDQMSQRRFAA